MPRGSRIVFENAFFHIFNRGVAKQKIFLDSSDYRKFLTRLDFLKKIKKYDHSIYSYVLMPNHFHLLIQIKKIPLSKIMSSLLTSYSMYFNYKYKRVGPLFQNRYKSKLCQKDNYFLGASRYIHLNPIKDGLTKNISDYPWSSYQELFGKTDFQIIDSSEVFRLIGKSEQDKQNYHDFLMEGINLLNELENEYQLNQDIDGSPRFNTISQKKYLRIAIPNLTSSSQNHRNPLE